MASSRSPWRYLVRALMVLGVLCAVIWTGAVGFLWWNEPEIVFRTGRLLNRLRPLDPSFKPTTIIGADGLRLDAVTLEGSQPSGSAYWILFSNGSAGSIYLDRVQDQLEQLHELGYNVLAFDYRGFGRSPGAPTEAGLYADAMASYEYLTETRRIDPARVILAGRSLGSAVAVELGIRVPSAGLLLLSPIDSIPLMGERIYPWVPVRYLAANRFDSVGKADRVRAPAIVVHALDDRFVPIDAARAVFARLSGPKLMVETRGGHNGAGFSPVSELRDALATFWPLQGSPEDADP